MSLRNIAIHTKAYIASFRSDRSCAKHAKFIRRLKVDILAYIRDIIVNHCIKYALFFGFHKDYSRMNWRFGYKKNKQTNM